MEDPVKDSLEVNQLDADATDSIPKKAELETRQPKTILQQLSLNGLCVNAARLQMKNSLANHGNVERVNQSMPV